MIIPDIDDLVLEPDDEGGIEELGRRVLSRGPWTHGGLPGARPRPPGGGPWEGPFLWLHRYQKVAQGWKLVSRFRTTEADQLRGLVRALGDWGRHFVSEPVQFLPPVAKLPEQQPAALEIQHREGMLLGDTRISAGPGQDLRLLALEVQVGPAAAGDDVDHPPGPGAGAARRTARPSPAFR